MSGPGAPAAGTVIAHAVVEDGACRGDNSETREDRSPPGNERDANMKPARLFEGDRLGGNPNEDEYYPSPFRHIAQIPTRPIPQTPPEGKTVRHWKQKRHEPQTKKEPT